MPLIYVYSQFLVRSSNYPKQRKYTKAKKGGYVLYFKIQ